VDHFLVLHMITTKNYRVQFVPSDTTTYLGGIISFVAIASIVVICLESLDHTNTSYIIAYFKRIAYSKYVNTYVSAIKIPPSN